MGIEMSLPLIDKISKDLTTSKFMCPIRQAVIFRNNRTSESHTEEVTYQYALAV